MTAHHGDSYGTLVNNYMTYATSKGGMEHILGRMFGIDQFGDLNGKDVLEVGCGPGTNGEEIRRRGGRLTGVDISKIELEAARKIDPTNIYIHYDGSSLAEAIEGKKFDFILFSFSACTMTKEVLQRLLHDARQLLKPGGKLVIIEPNLEVASGVWYFDLHYHKKKGVRSEDHVRVTLGRGKNKVELYHDIYRTHNDNLRMLADAGFRVSAIHQPKPRTLRERICWWPAHKKPPFAIFVAE